MKKILLLAICLASLQAKASVFEAANRRVLRMQIKAAELTSDDAPSPCHLPTVHSIMMPLRGGSTKTFQYQYQLLPAASPDAPLVIFIPGGPGDNSISTRDPRPSAAYAVLLTDPRGSGCNDNDSIQDADISSEQIADDVIEIVRRLKPSHYIVHGHSFGTVVATIVSHKIAAAHVPQPEAIILEGVVGKRTAFKVEGFGMEYSWARVKPRLSAQTQAALAATKAIPFSLSNNAWINAINFTTFLGAIAWSGYDYDRILHMSMDAIGGNPDPKFEALMDLAGDGEGSLPFSEKVFAAIACNELFDHTVSDTSYNDGAVIDASETVCEPTRLHPYDSANWQMNQKTFYFMGQNDPDTPMPEGIYHFNHQLQKNKMAVIVHDAGHMSLQLNLRDCLPQIYSTVSSGGDLASVLRTCAASTQVKSAL